MNKINILIVEDEKIERETLADILREDGYSVSTAGNGPDAIKKLNKQYFNLMLIDIILPGINGIEVLKKAKKIYQNIAIIMVTAYASIENTITALNEGADGYILKPPNIDEIKLFIKRSLEKQKLIMENKKLQKSLQKANDELKKSYLATLKTLAHAIELKDPFTKGHSLRVIKYADKIAKKMDFTKENLNIIKNTGLLHDIGKIAISDLILQKNGKLTKNEWKIMKKHPEIGEDIISPFLSFHVEQKAIRHHHERYDGKGYPDGLKGEEIPLLARILSVADSYDAMTSLRPYRKKMTVKKAVSELKENAGTQFDFKIVNVLLKILKEENII